MIPPFTLKQLARREEQAPRFMGGHALCAGCGIPAVVRTVLGSIETPVVVANATGCLEVATTRFPDTAWNVPWIHVAFENAPAVMSGVEAAWRALARRASPLAEQSVTLVVFAGDGGTYDIGLQALSGALDRGHRMLYVCYDNEAYMNTGIQRSGATPFGARTTTTPVGAGEVGNLRRRKDLTGIVAAHHIPYVAQASMSHLADLGAKVCRGVAADGPAFINVLSACPLGWGMESRDSISVMRLAVETNFWPLFEVIEGHWRLTYEPDAEIPLPRFLESQARFRHLLGDADALETAERWVVDDWLALRQRVEADRSFFSDYE